MENFIPFKNSVAAYFMEGASESFYNLVLQAADQYVFHQINLKDFARFASDEQYESWKSELDDKGVEWRDKKFLASMEYRREDPMVHCFFMRHFLAFGAGLEFLLREQFATAHAKTEKEITAMIHTDITADNSCSQSSEMEILDSPMHQSTIDTSQIPDSDDDDAPFTVVTHKKKKKSKKNKQKHVETNTTSAKTPPASTPASSSKPPITFTKPSPSQVPISNTSAKPGQNNSNRAQPKKNKPEEQRVDHIITGYQPEGSDLLRTKDLLIYDIPVLWDLHHLLQQFSAWGRLVSLKRKCQRKYQTVRIKIALTDAYYNYYHAGQWTVLLSGHFVRWFPAEWTLPERKQRERFQAVIRDLPADFTMDTLITNRQPTQFLQDAGFKSFKLISTVDGKRKLVGYYESWDKLMQRISIPQAWNDVMLDWSRHSAPTTNFTGLPKKLRSQKNTRREKTGALASGTNLTPLAPGRFGPRNNQNIGTNTSRSDKKTAAKKNSTASQQPNQHKILSEICGLFEKLGYRIGKPLQS